MWRGELAGPGGKSRSIEATPQQLEELVVEYLKTDFPGRRPATIRCASQFVGRWIKWLKARRYTSVNYESLQRYVTEIHANYKPKTAFEYWVSVRRFLRWMVRAGHTESMPHELVRMPTLERTPPRSPITVDEYTKLRAAAAGHWMDWIILLGWHTGMSISDCMSLRWRDVDMDSCVISIRRMKSGVDSTIPFTPADELGRALASRREAAASEGPDDFVCWDAGVRLRTDHAPGCAGISAFREIAKRAGVDKTFHSLRHAFVSMLANSGMNMALATKVSGHTDPRIFARYTHPDKEALRSEVSKAIAGSRSHMEVVPSEPIETRKTRKSFMWRPDTTYIVKRGRLKLPDGALVQFVRTGSDADGKVTVVTPCDGSGKPTSSLQLVVDIRDVNRFG